MAHALVGLLGRCIDGKLRVGLFGLGEGHLGVRPVDARGRGHQQVVDLQPPRHLHDVERPYDVAVDVGARILDRVTHTRLGGEMNDHVRPERLGDGDQDVSIFEPCFRA